MVVSTDAIGMGLNLPVRRIVFIQTEKYDGHQKRKLEIPEIKQIAGRAGRYGIYETGYVSAAEILTGSTDPVNLRKNWNMSGNAMRRRRNRSAG